MFFRQISDFEENFKFLDRLNAIVFNVWKDGNAEAYKSQSMDQLEMFCRNYVNEMRQKSNEMKALQAEIAEALNDLQKIHQDLQMLAVEPEIHGCILCTANGKISEHTSGTEHFILRKGEDADNLDEYAFERCTELQSIEKAFCEEPL